MPHAAKSNPLKLSSVFSTTAQNFIVKIYTFMYYSQLHFTAQLQLTKFKYCKIIDFLARPPSDFCYHKMFAL